MSTPTARAEQLLDRLWPSDCIAYDDALGAILAYAEEIRREERAGFRLALESAWACGGEAAQRKAFVDGFSEGWINQRRHSSGEECLDAFSAYEAWRGRDRTLEMLISEAFASRSSRGD